METWKSGDIDIETSTWRHVHGNEEMDMDKWRHGSGDIDMETWT
jgi:hypothetical protein